MTNESNTPIQHTVPKCTYCGHIGEWSVEPVMRPMDWVLTCVFALMCLFPAICYLIPVLAIRSNEKNRAKSCKKCNAKNMFTFTY